MKTPLKLSVRGLDAQTKQYLQLAASQQDNTVWAMYCGSRVRMPYLAIGLGIGLMLLAINEIFRESHFMQAPDQPIWPMFALPVGALLLIDGGWTALLILTKRSLGAFHFVDANYWWQVDLRKVVAHPVDTARQVSGLHRFREGAYAGSEITVDGTTFHLAEKTTAEQIQHFLGALQAMRNDPTTRLADPITLGRVAKRVTGQSPDSEAVPRTIPLPAGKAHSLLCARNILTVGCAAAVAVGTWLLLPRLAVHQKDEQLFIEAELGREAENEYPLDHYLLELPAGRHAATVREWRDELRFGRARSLSDQTGSPDGLREYLADMTNTRFRSEAQILINEHYDAAIRRLKGLVGGEVEDAGLVDVLVDLLEDLKQADSPAVSVAFEASHVPSPQTPEISYMESRRHRMFEDSDPRIKEMASRSPDRSAIIPFGEAFSAEQIAHRQGVILDRLRASFEKILDADLLELRAAEVSGLAKIRLAYHTCPSGNFHLYEHEGVTKGLLRTYRIDWAISVQFSNGQVLKRELESRPLSQLKMELRGGEPVWAPYAVIMYSAFHDFSDQLIGKFGMKPPPKPDRFSFANAAGLPDPATTFHQPQLLGTGQFPPAPPGSVKEWLNEEQLKKISERLKRIRPSTSPDGP